MARVLTITTIHQVLEAGKAKTATSKAVPPKIKIIPAGEIITVDGEYEQELRLSGAIRDVQKGETIAVPASKMPLMDASEDELAGDGDVKAKKPGKAKAGKAKEAKDADDDTDNTNLV